MLSGALDPKGRCHGMHAPRRTVATQRKGACLKIIHLYRVGRRMRSSRAGPQMPEVHALHGNCASDGETMKFGADASGLVALLSHITPSARHHCNNSSD